ncbi:MAG: hypothetical protein JST81_03155 [Bacteroidetes bacterium]|nr:hypothetical protein [Bacteroidota bacterium]
MSKKVLAIYFSQSGQLGEIIDNITAPLAGPGITIEKVRVQPATPYPFPWKGNSFFAVMPDCVLSVPTALAPFQLKENKYDLVILGYQAWFLSPSIPFNSILSEPTVKTVLKDTPVVMVTGARNMWITAFEKSKVKLKEIGAKLAGNIALVDKHANFVSFVTIFYWMLKGKKGRALNIFPKPGVSDEDIAGAREFGVVVAQHLNSGKWEDLQPALVAKKAVEIKYRLMFIESKASRIFSIWANIIVKKKNRSFWLSLFKYYLIIALFVAAPIILTVDAIFFKPFLLKKIRARKQYLLGVN